MTFDFPQRVRCIEGSSFFTRGQDYKVLRLLGINMCVVEGPHVDFVAKSCRFKPVVRRVAGSIRT